MELYGVFIYMNKNGVFKSKPKILLDYELII